MSIEKVISGGQTGADIAGLMVAKAFGIETGGWMPKGFITQAGPKPEWSEKYNLQEHSSPKYPGRTCKNVEDSDGTIRIAGNFGSAGERLTLRAITDCKKPHFDVDISSPPQVKLFVEWIKRYDIKVLNVAGNSERTWNGITGEAVDYLTRCFEALGFKELDA